MKTIHIVLMGALNGIRHLTHIRRPRCIIHGLGKMYDVPLSKVYDWRQSLFIVAWLDALTSFLNLLQQSYIVVSQNLTCFL